MSQDLVSLIIAGVSGVVMGAIIAVAVMANLACRASARASKQAWAAAEIYYRKKAAER